MNERSCKSQVISGMENNQRETVDIFFLGIVVNQFGGDEIVL